MILLNIASVTTLAMFAPNSISLVLLISIALVTFLLASLDKYHLWSDISGLVMMLSVARLVNDRYLLTASAFIATAYNILLALRFRSETNRWLSTILWLFLPIALGAYNNWPTEFYAWLYVLVMFALIVSRAIARGVGFASAKIPLAAYTRSASLSYVFGYSTAGILAIIISLTSSDSQLHTTAILSVIGLSSLILSLAVEKKSTIMVVQPFVWQMALFSLLRPTDSSTLINMTFLLSSLMAIGFYLIGKIGIKADENEKYLPSEFRPTSMITAFITPASFLVITNTYWMMPVGLFVASVMIFDYVKYLDQSYKEMSVGLMVASIMWLMYFFGVREVQAYTHVVALMFAGFAYWRSIIKDNVQTDNYLYLMLAIATIPLAIQLLTGSKGGVYGWWLVLQQVVFMLAGMMIGKKFVTLWGLYVAIGVVLYQLRNLGWAALTVLAVFIIGVAIQQLQKYNINDNNKRTDDEGK
jgi:hypothetical protein